jgi:filamentous hemagglutinin family protein
MTRLVNDARTSQFRLHSDRIGRTCAALVAIASLGISQLRANPSGGTVVAGSATIGSAAGNALQVVQASNRAIIDWNSFSIGSGEATTFVQPSATSAMLNRVTGSNPSTLLGSLNANGQVFLINQNGIVVGQGATINAGSFAASTLDISNASFMAGGDLLFSGNSNAAVTNLGSITASQGDVYLVAQQVTNAGAISAANRTAGLAAGTEVTLTQNGAEHVLVSAPVTQGGAGAAVLNSGVIKAAQAELKAAGGNFYALAINNTGVVRATGTRTINGQVYLTADDTGSIANSGTLAASSADGSGGKISVAGGSTSGSATISGTVDASATGAGANGGQVTITRANVAVQAGASVAANGTANGGTILIGGDIHGGANAAENLSPTAVARAQQTSVASGAFVSADGGVGGGWDNSGNCYGWGY